MAHDVNSWRQRAANDELLGAPLKRKGRLADQLYEQILKQIVAGRMSEGARLPSEKDLCTLFKVSRPVVREALTRLNADGLVVSRRGSGSYVQRRPSADFIRLAPAGSVAELFRCWELRIALECEAAMLAARRRTEADLKAIECALDDYAGLLGTAGVGNEVDLRFHMAVSVASGNGLLTSVLDSLRDSTAAGMKLAHKLSWADNQERLAKILEEHREVFEAVKAGDAERAGRAMRLHIENARGRIFGVPDRHGEKTDGGGTVAAGQAVSAE